MAFLYDTIVAVSEKQFPHNPSNGFVKSKESTSVEMENTELIIINRVLILYNYMNSGGNDLHAKR